MMADTVETVDETVDDTKDNPVTNHVEEDRDSVNSSVDVSGDASSREIETITGEADEFVPDNPVADVKMLLQKVRKQDFGMVKQILSKSPSLKMELTDEVGKTVLHYLCTTAKIEELRMCLDKKQNLNITDKMGWTPLHYASMRGHAEVVKMLSDSGANCNTPETQKGRTPLHLAVSRNHRNVVDVLLECGADPSIKDKEGKTAGDISKHEFMKDFLETAVENATNALGEVRLETMEISRDKPTPFPNIGIVVTPQTDTNQSTLQGFTMSMRRISTERNSIDFGITEMEEMCSHVFSYKIKSTHGGALDSIVTDISIPILTEPSPSEELVLKTDTKDEFVLNTVKEENEKHVCIATLDISTLNSFVVVCRPKQERFPVTKAAMHIISAVDQRVELDIPKGTFDKQATITLEITEPPSTEVLAKVLKDCPEIMSITSFYSLETDGHKLAKPIDVKVPLPNNYSGNGTLVVLSMDDTPENETPDSWKIIDSGVTVKAGRVEFSVPSFSIKVATETSFSADDEKSMFGSQVTLRSNVSRVFRKSRHKEHKIAFFCMTRRIGTSNSFKVLVQCCKADQRSSKLAYWEGEGYEHQEKGEENSNISVTAKTKFKIVSNTINVASDENENVLEFHPKLDNYLGFIVKISDQKSSTTGVLELYKLEKKVCSDDGLDVYEKMDDTVATLEVTMLKFHPMMMEATDGRSFLTYKRMLALQDGMGDNWWKILLLMDVPFKTMEDALKQTAGDVAEKINGMLFEWREKHMSDRSRGLPILFSALCRCGRRGIVNDMQIDLRKWKRKPENRKDGFYDWLVTAYKFDLLVPTRYGKPMSDTFLAVLADDIEPTMEFAKVLSLPQGTAADVLSNTKVYTTKGLLSMKMLVLFRQGIPDVLRALETLLQSLANAKLIKQRKYAVMTTKAWLKRATTDEPLKMDMEQLISRIDTD